jgi:hypothetical protein
VDLSTSVVLVLCTRIGLTEISWANTVQEYKYLICTVKSEKYEPGITTRNFVILVRTNTDTSTRRIGRRSTSRTVLVLRTPEYQSSKVVLVLLQLPL